MATVNKNFKTKNGIDAGGKITGPASTTDSATLNIPHGVDPTSPVNGDIWTTTSELYARINGSTRFFLRDNATNFTNAQNINSITGPTTLQLAYGTTSTGFTKTINIGPNGASGSTTNINIGSSTSGATNSTTVRGSFTVTGKATTAATTTTQAGLNLPHGTAPSAPVDGDLWTTTAGVYARVNGATVGPFGSMVTVSDTAPVGPSAGNMWFNSASGKIYIYFDSSWVEVGGGNSNAGSSYQSTAPSSPVTGQIWVDSDDNVQYIWTGSAWTALSNPDTVTLTGTQTLTNKTLTDPKITLATNAQAGTTYTLDLTDRDKIVELNNASPITLSIPTNSSVAFPIGSTITVLQTGAGQVTIAAVTPGTTTVNGTPGLKLRTQWSSATLIKRNTDLWVVIGDLAA